MSVRGISPAESIEVIRDGTPVQARSGREAREKVFRFESLRGGLWYGQKKVRVVFVIERDTVVNAT